MLEAILRNWRHTLVEPPAARTGSQNAADAAQENEGEIVAVAKLERRRRLLTQVDEALCRLAAGRYGLCANCGEPIPLARLRALPFAVRCCPCQERWERRTRGGAMRVAAV